METLGERPLNRVWRLIISPPGSGAWNMALDESLSESVRNGGRPMLRFYTWEPATLSLGRFQNLTTGLTPEARQVPLVRRPTGGGGIWHADELTYSLACAPEDLDVKGVKASFERLCGFLVRTWILLGWKAGFAKDGGGEPERLGQFQPACFAGQEEFDIVVAGRKLGGNAQRRDRGSIFQHGSLPLVLDHSALARLFLPGFRPAPHETTDLRSCGWQGSARDLIPLLTDSFSQHLGVEVESDGPTEDEVARAETLETEQFGSALWTESAGGRLREV